MRILIAGCGDVGNTLGRLLLERGHEVFGLKRDVSTLPAGVKPVAADLTKPSTLSALPANIDRLVFMPTPGRRERSAYEAVFVDGLRNLWTCMKQPPGRLIVASSTSVYGQSDGARIDESTPPVPARFNGEVLLDMERLARRCSPHSIVLRIAGIYGPGREGMIRLARSAGREVQKEPPFFTNRIHVEDVARAISHLLFLEAPEDLYLACDDLPAPRYEVLKWLARQLGVEPPAGVSIEHADRGKRIDNQRLKRSGFSLSYPDYRAGYGALLGFAQTD